MTQREKKKIKSISYFMTSLFKMKSFYSVGQSHFLYYLIAFCLFVCFLAAQKARDEFNEVERSLREVSDQIR